MSMELDLNLFILTKLIGKRYFKYYIFNIIIVNVHNSNEKYVEKNIM